MYAETNKQTNKHVLGMLKSNLKNPLNFSTKRKCLLAGSCRQDRQLLLCSREQAAWGGCCQDGKRNELLAASASLTSTSLLPPLVSAVRNEGKGSVAFPFSLGA